MSNHQQTLFNDLLEQTVHKTYERILVRRPANSRLHKMPVSCPPLTATRSGLFPLDLRLTVGYGEEDFETIVWDYIDYNFTLPKINKATVWAEAHDLRSLLGDSIRARVGLPIDLPTTNPNGLSPDWATFVRLWCLPARMIDGLVPEHAISGRYQAASQTRDRAGVDSTLRSVYSSYLGAKGLFAPKKWAGKEKAILDKYGRPLPMPPNLHEFMCIAPLEVDIVEHEAPSVDEYWAYKEELSALKYTDVATYLFLVLCEYAGTRSAETFAAQVEELVEAATRTLDIRPKPELITKNGRSREVQMDPHIWGVVQHLSAGREHIVAATKRERRAAMRKAVAFVSKHLKAVRNPLHLLRRCFASSQLLQTDDLELVSIMLGHANLDVTFRYYFLHKYTMAHMRIHRDWKG